MNIKNEYFKMLVYLKHCMELAYNKKLFLAYLEIKIIWASFFKLIRVY